MRGVVHGPCRVHAGGVCSAGWWVPGSGLAPLPMRTCSAWETLEPPLLLLFMWLLCWVWSV